MPIAYRISGSRLPCHANTGTSASGIRLGRTRSVDARHDARGERPLFQHQHGHQRPSRGSRHVRHRNHHMRQEHWRCQEQQRRQCGDGSAAGGFLAEQIGEPQCEGGQNGHDIKRSVVAQEREKRRPSPSADPPDRSARSCRQERTAGTRAAKTPTRDSAMRNPAPTAAPRVEFR